MKVDDFKNWMIRDEGGFTLVELIIAFAVFAILTAVLTPIFKQGNGFWQTTGHQAELRQNLNFAMELMAKEIRQSSNVIPGSAANPGEKIVTVNGNSFLLQNGSDNKKYIEFRSEPLTSTELIDITDARVTSLSSPSNGYEISITARFAGNTVINEADREMTVITRVFSRPVDGIQTWKEIN